MVNPTIYRANILYFFVFTKFLKAFALGVGANAGYSVNDPYKLSLGADEDNMIYQKDTL